MSDAILPDIPVSALDNIEEQYTALVDLRTKLESLYHALLANPAIADIANTAATVGASYVQAEVQQIADDTEIASDKIDTLLATLRTAGIIGE